MRVLLIVVSVFISFILYGQAVTSKIVSVNSQERNKKEIIFLKKIQDSNTSFLLRAKNETSKEYSKCSWESVLSEKELLHFTDVLGSLPEGAEYEHSSFRLRSVRGKVYIYFDNTKCQGEHKTHYFQKSCNRTLSFNLLNKQVENLCDKLISLFPSQIVKR